MPAVSMPAVSMDDDSAAPGPAPPIAIVGVACRFPDADDALTLLDMSLAGRRASGEAATARAIKPLRFQGFTALHDRRLASGAVPGIPPVDI